MRRLKYEPEANMYYHIHYMDSQKNPKSAGTPPCVLGYERCTNGNIADGSPTLKAQTQKPEPVIVII